MIVKYIDQIELSGKKVFIRADLNVPFDDSGAISDDNRIQASVPTIRYALDHGAKVIVASHLGRPKGRDMSQSLAPVARRLQEILGVPVTLGEDCVGEAVEKQAQALQPKQVLLLENLRFHKEEEKNDPAFAQSLAKLCEVYVNDAFATAHRAHASTEGMVKLVPVAAGGFTLKSEVEYFNKAFAQPERPFVAVFGGAKVSDKIKAIKNVGSRANRIVVGGAMANTFFAAEGLSVGKSLHEPEQLETARATKKFLAEKNCELVLPVDVVVAPELKAGSPKKVVDVSAIPADQMALDIGPKSVELFKNAFADAKTIIWNGPMGAFETPDFAAGTYGIVDALAASQALTVVGGGDTDVALHQRHAFEKMSYVSTAGGAFLCLLEGSPLPAVEALENKR
ncbi:MAG: phosphoglycerate kinase [Bdellovibrionota bacterium]